MPVAYETRNHIFDFKKSSNPDEFLVITDELVSQFTILSYVKVNWDVGIFKIVGFCLLNDNFLVLLDSDLLLENVGRYKVFEIDWGIYHMRSFRSINEVLLDLLTQNSTLVKLLLQ